MEKREGKNDSEPWRFGRVGNIVLNKIKKKKKEVVTKAENNYLSRE